MRNSAYVGGLQVRHVQGFRISRLFSTTKQKAGSYSPTANVIVILGGGTDRNHFTYETWIYRLGPNKWVQVPKP
jgi:hypothetical protein